MTEAFLTVFNLSIVASWFVLAILILRKIFSKAPRSIFCILWLLVGLRLAIPFSLESIFSLIPSAETISPEIIYQARPNIETGFQTVNNIINPVIGESLAATPQYSANPVQIILAIASNIWVLGAVLIILYGIISYAILKIKVREAVPLEDNIKQSAKIASPFILGFIRPKIYIPFGMDKRNLDYVLAHERAHLKRRDHLIKPIGFALLAVYWFNPVIWIAYIFLCRDIELACDEKVVKDFEADERAKYATALLDCSINRRSIAACPLAFGEVGVKERIKKTLSYKKPVLWLIIAAIVSAIIISVCFMTDPKTDDEAPIETTPETNTDTTDSLDILAEWDIKKIGYAPELAKFMCGSEEGNACIKISNVGELEDFLSELHSNPFEDITEPIEKVYFENNLLLAVYYTSGSGSFIFEIEDVKIDNKNKSISISSLCTMPEVYTDDMSGWLGLVEIKNIYDTDIADYNCTEKLNTRQYKAPQLSKTCIEKTDNWKTEGLKSAGLEGVEITFSQSCSQGTLYLLEEKDPFYVIDKHFFLAIEKDHRILLTEVTTALLSRYINCCDLDGDQEDEILLMLDYGGNGGAGSHGTFIYKVEHDKIVQAYHSSYHFNNEHGFTTSLTAPFSIEVKNSFTGYSTSIDIRNVYAPYFDEQGNPALNVTAGFDCIYSIEPKDVDNDGIYEIICNRYSYLGSRSDGLGDAITTLKYDKAMGAFRIIDAEFVPYKEKEGKITTDYYELITFTQNPTDSYFTYTYTVFDKNGDNLFGRSSFRKPTFEMISENVLRVYTQAGTGLSTRTNYYYDLKHRLVSDGYTYVLDDSNKLIAYGYFNGETTLLVVKNIFNDGYKKEFILDNISTNTVDPIISAEFSDDLRYIRIKYFSGNNYETSIIDLPI